MTPLEIRCGTSASRFGGIISNGVDKLFRYDIVQTDLKVGELFNIKIHEKGKEGVIMSSNNPRIEEIEGMQDRLRKRAEEEREKGNLDLHFVLHVLVGLLEGDKLFIAPPTLLEAYRNILRDATIEVDGMKWPISSLFSTTSNEVR